MQARRGAGRPQATAKRTLAERKDFEASWAVEHAGAGVGAERTEARSRLGIGLGPGPPPHAAARVPAGRRERQAHAPIAALFLDPLHAAACFACGEVRASLRLRLLCASRPSAFERS